MGQGQYCIFASDRGRDVRCTCAQDRIVMGAERRSSYIDERVKRLTAYHEGGHALTALYTDGAMPLHKVTCMPRGHALGVVRLTNIFSLRKFLISDIEQTSQLPKDDRLMVTHKEFLADIDVALGGRVAEELIFGPENVTSGASSDLRKATATATRMVKASPVCLAVYDNGEHDSFFFIYRIGGTRIRLARCISMIKRRASP